MSRLRLSGKRPAEPLEARLAAIARQLETYERRLGDISRAHALAEVTTKHELAGLRQRLAHLEAVNHAQRATIDTLEQHQARHLERLQDTLKGQREALASIEDTLEAELPPPQPDPLQARSAAASS